MIHRDDLDLSVAKHLLRDATRMAQMVPRTPPKLPRVHVRKPFSATENAAVRSAMAAVRMYDSERLKALEVRQHTSAAHQDSLTYAVAAARIADPARAAIQQRRIQQQANMLLKQQHERMLDMDRLLANLQIRQPTEVMQRARALANQIVTRHRSNAELFQTFDELLAAQDELVETAVAEAQEGDAAATDETTTSSNATGEVASAVDDVMQRFINVMEEISGSADRMEINLNSLTTHIQQLVAEAKAAQASTVKTLAVGVLTGLLVQAIWFGITSAIAPASPEGQVRPKAVASEGRPVVGKHNRKALDRSLLRRISCPFVSVREGRRRRARCVCHLYYDDIVILCVKRRRWCYIRALHNGEFIEGWVRSKHLCRLR